MGNSRYFLSLPRTPCLAPLRLNNAHGLPAISRFLAKVNITCMAEGTL